MSWGLFAAGLALLALAFYDLVKTTLGQGGGPLTNRITATAWRLALAVHRRRPAHSLLTTAGIGAVLLVLVLWLTLVWGGWTLIFSAGESAVVWSETQRPATVAERSRFAAYSMVTLGMGDFEPEGGAWKLATALAAASGFSLLTLSLTYLTPLVGAATARRQLGLYVTALGSNPTGIVRTAWDGESCRGLEPHLQNLTPMIALLAERHLTYPALHYFHARPRAAAAIGIAALDEALTLLRDACPAARAPSPALVEPARRAITALLATVAEANAEAVPEPPPAPDTADLRGAGVPLVDGVELARRLASHRERRRLLAAFVASDGWSWQDVAAGRPET